MIKDIVLNTTGYQLTFELKELQHSKDNLDLTIVFSLDPRLSNVVVKSIPMPILISDLQGMIDYFEEHIASLQENPDSEGYTFVTLDLQFQMQAFSGEVRSPDDGEFTLRSMVNIGKLNSEGSSVYVGGETLVTLENINSFISSIRDVIVKRTLS